MGRMKNLDIEVRNMASNLGYFLYKERALDNFYRRLIFNNLTMREQIMDAIRIDGRIHAADIMLFPDENPPEGHDFWVTLTKKWLEFLIQAATVTIPDIDV